MYVSGNFLTWSDKFRILTNMGTDLNDNIGNLLTLMSPRTSFIGQEISAVIWQKGFNDIFENFDIFAGKLLLWLELTLYEVVWPYHVSKPLFEHPLLS